MTRAGMAASRCSKSYNANHSMVVWKRSRISGRLLMRCTKCGWSSVWR